MEMPNTVLDDICVEIGYTATNVLAAWFGGDYLKVPAAVTEEHPLTKAIGAAAMRRLVSAWGGKRLWVPTGHWHSVEARDKRIAGLIVNGMAPGQIAEETGLSIRRVYQIKQRLEQTGLLEVVRRIREQNGVKK
jgi:DNA-binding NarL/FixJ family response regulator